MKEMENSRDYLQGAYDAASWIQGILEAWGERPTRPVLEDLTSKLLMAMESNFMEVFELDWPDSKRRPDDFILGPVTEGDGIDESAAQP
jgi:hypothetical protein